jgi:Domain of unknown function (DUF5615)
LEGNFVLKFLIDECLSPNLVAIALNAGYPESSHVVWQGKAGWKDWELKPFILEGDWTLVPQNSDDFRGPVENPGTKGQYADVPIHAGLICLNGPYGMRSAIQCELFQAALDELAGEGQFVNEVIEIDLEEFDGEIRVRRYPLPVEGV